MQNHIVDASPNLLRCNDPFDGSCHACEIGGNPAGYSQEVSRWWICNVVKAVHDSWCLRIHTPWYFVD